MTAEQTARLSLPDGQSVTAIWTLPSESAAGWAAVYAPGAGATIRDGFGVFAAQQLAAQGMAVLRFQFLYAELGRRFPDKREVLEDTWRAAIAAARDRCPRLVIGGRSMGGRIASQVVAQGERVDALALFAYPLHPPGKPETRRDAHLDRIAVPTWFCSGTHDPFATPEELQAAAALVPEATVHLLESADHGFHAPKASGRTQKQIWSEAISAFTTWLAELQPSP